MSTDRLQNSRRPGAPLQDARLREPISLSDALPVACAGVADECAPGLSRLQLAWPEICGAAIARHTQPTGLDGRLLVVEAADGQAREVLFRERARLTRRVQRWLPDVRGVRLVTVSPRRDGPPPPAPSLESAPPDPRTQVIDDPGLRAALDGLLHSADARAGSS